MSGEDAPGVGDAVLDEDRGLVGRITAADADAVRLRPLGGGPQWDADPARVRDLSQDELLHALVAEVNARSRQEYG